MCVRFPGQIFLNNYDDYNFYCFIVFLYQTYDFSIDLQLASCHISPEEQQPISAGYATIAISLELSYHVGWASGIYSIFENKKIYNLKKKSDIFFISLGMKEWRLPCYRYSDQKSRFSDALHHYERNRGSTVGAACVVQATHAQRAFALHLTPGKLDDFNTIKILPFN